MRLRFSALCLFLVLFVAGCSGAGQLTYSSSQEAFEKGIDSYEAGNYERAIKYFRAVFTYGRSGEWADDAQLYVARAYRADKRYLLAASEYQRFMQLYRSDERLPQAEYERAMSLYALSPGYQLDQSNTRRALDAFQLFADRYPQSDLVPNAEARITELREKLAHKQFSAAQQYERREMYEGAAVTYEIVFDQYADTKWADDALVGAMRAYIAYSDLSVQSRQAERLQQAVENYRRITQIFPDSPLLKEAESLYEAAEERLQRLGAEPPLAGARG